MAAEERVAGGLRSWAAAKFAHRKENFFLSVRVEPWQILLPLPSTLLCLASPFFVCCSVLALSLFSSLFLSHGSVVFFPRIRPRFPSKCFALPVLLVCSQVARCHVLLRPFCRCRMAGSFGSWARMLSPMPCCLSCCGHLAASHRISLDGFCIEGGCELQGQCDSHTSDACSDLLLHHGPS